MHDTQRKAQSGEQTPGRINRKGTIFVDFSESAGTGIIVAASLPLSVTILETMSHFDRPSWIISQAKAGNFVPMLRTIDCRFSVEFEVRNANTTRQ
eukprot:scaffold1819_cov160-Amphora_coffeaeformis.AAC.3